MAHPRAEFPPILALEYNSMGMMALARKYQSNHVTIRRWLTDQGVTIRKHGLRVKP